MRNPNEYVPLAQFSEYRIGGPARYFFDARSVRDIAAAAEWALLESQPLFALGAGTNLLIGDEGFSGVVVRPAICFLESDGNTVHAGAGVLFSELLDFAAERGLSGLEWAGGLPGTVGGAIRGNAGAFGGETKDVIGRVYSFDVATLEPVSRTNGESSFGYRTSVFKRAPGREVITSAVFRLGKGNPEAIRKAIQEKIDYRAARHPMDYPNIGSIFKNVPAETVPVRRLAAMRSVIKKDPFPVVPAAHLISESGLKGVTFGGAMVSPKHPNFIVNVLGATASDVRALIELVQSRVAQKFGVQLEPEVEML